MRKSFFTRPIFLLFLALTSLFLSAFYLRDGMRRLKVSNRIKFEAISERHSQSIKNRLGQKKDILIAIKSFIKASESISKSEFDIFTSSYKDLGDPYQICWKGRNSVYYLHDDRQSICSKLDPLNEAHVIRGKNGAHFLAFSTFARSSNRSQAIRPSILFAIDKALLKELKTPEVPIDEFIYVVDLLGNSSYALNLEGQRVGLGNNKELFFYRDLGSFGDSKFVYAARPIKSNTSQDFNLYLAASLIFILGMASTFYIRVLQRKHLRLAKEAEEFSAELDETKEDLKELSLRNRMALKASSIGVWEWDIINDTLNWDDQMFALHKAERRGPGSAYESWVKALHPEDQERCAREVDLAINGKQRFDTSFRILWPSGEVRYIKAFGEVYYGEDHKAHTMIGVNWDITKVKENEYGLIKTNLDLERSNDELFQFSYRASHDLKAPLTTIKGLSSLIIEDIKEGAHDEAIENTKSIRAQAESLEVFLGDLLDLAKADLVDEGAVEVDFDGLIKEIQGDYSSEMKKHEVSLRQDIEVIRDWHFPLVRLKQVFTNLISNGIKYSDPQKNDRFVKVEITDRSGKLVVKVSDNGLGIPYESKNDVFSMFKRFHSKKITGSGIGLYIIKKHIESLGATIDFETSKAGTVFTIIFE